MILDENYFNKIIAYVNKNYLVHNIPENKISLVSSGDKEYENNTYKIVSKNESEKILEKFGGAGKFKKHCDLIISIIREERGEKSLLEDENFNIVIESLPDRGWAPIWEVGLFKSDKSFFFIFFIVFLVCFLV